jgi:polyisoprenoid-binding protein YceI
MARTRLLCGVLVVWAISVAPPLTAQTDMYALAKGTVSFVSDAPHERIAARTERISALFDVARGSFGVQVPMASLAGFNSPLQQVHFNENYVESNAFPFASFQGRLIETFDPSRTGVYRLRAKGQFTVHGVTQERIIECDVVVAKEGIRVRSIFHVPLADHHIRVPHIVHQKIAPQVRVEVDLLFHERQAGKG